MPQDLKYKGETNSILIGENNLIREYVTINPGTEGGGGKTIIGNNCLFMVSSHIAHDCKVGSNIVIANNAAIAGHVTIEDSVIIGGNSAVQQFTRIGRLSDDRWYDRRIKRCYPLWSSHMEIEIFYMGLI